MASEFEAMRDDTMRCETLRNMGFAAFLGSCILGIGADQADAQLLGRRRVTVQEAAVAPSEVVAPPSVVVAPTRLKVRPRKVVIREKRSVIALVPSVVTSTPVVSKPHAVGSPPVEEERVLRPGPFSEDRDINLERLMEAPVLSPPR